MNKEIEIQSIEKSKKNKKYKIITNDNEYLFSEDIIIKYHLNKGNKYSKDEFFKIINDATLDTYFNKTLFYISNGLRSLLQVKKYIIDLIYKDKRSELLCYVDEIITRIITLGYIDDLLMANTLVEYYIDSLKSPLYIKQKLINKQIEDEIIKQSLLRYTKDIEEEIIKAKLEKEKNTRFTPTKYKQYLKEKYIKNGFSYDLVSRLVEKIEVDDLSDNLIKNDYEKLVKRCLNKDYDIYEQRKYIYNSLLKKGYKSTQIKIMMNKNSD